MRLKALDQIHVSAVKSDSLRPGEEFDVSDEAGRDLLHRHPHAFIEVASESADKAEASPQNKAEHPPANKAEAPPANKAAKPPRKRGK